MSNQMVLQILKCKINDQFKMSKPKKDIYNLITQQLMHLSGANKKLELSCWFGIGKPNKLSKQSFCLKVHSVSI